MSKKLFNDTRTSNNDWMAKFEAIQNGTYTSGPMAASVEVAPMVEETVTDEQLANRGKDHQYVDENGVKQTAHSGLFLLNL